MANTKISALPASTTPLAGTEVLPIVQSGATKQVSVANLTAGRVVSVGSLTSNGSVTIGTNGPYAVGSLYSDVSWGMLFTAARASPINAEYAWLNSAGTELARIDTNGNTTIKIGSLIIGTSGKGIDFSATPGTGTSELLADYEEGTWTPTDASGASLSLTVNTAKYTKVGRLVTVNCYVTYPATVSAAAALITLPFAATSFDIATAAAGTGAVFSGLTISGASNMSLRAPSLSSILNSQVSGADVIFTCSYMV